MVKALLLLITGFCMVIFVLFLLFFENRETVSVSPSQALTIGQKIWLNEGAGKVRNLTVWNEGEDFPSFGIGHFIWYPPDVSETFTESFPQLLAFISKQQRLPSWLNSSMDAPWSTREAFYADFDSVRMVELRDFLQGSVAQQTSFIIQRLQHALPSMLDSIDGTQHKQIQRAFYQVAQSESGLYALIDYVNFKGEGISTKERYENQGWGLLQVLAHMNLDNGKVMDEFVLAADYVLTRRVNNAPRDESQWLPGWRKRISSYNQPL